jgi:hypothetical protein
MRKRLITPIPRDAPAPNAGWLDLEGVAVVEVTSEEKEYPVESALLSRRNTWLGIVVGKTAITLIDRVLSCKSPDYGPSSRKTPR